MAQRPVVFHYPSFSSNDVIAFILINAFLSPAIPQPCNAAPNLLIVGADCLEPPNAHEGEKRGARAARPTCAGSLGESNERLLGTCRARHIAGRARDV
jgi:hypothetical protein